MVKTCIIVGLGGHARGSWALSIKKHPDWKIIGVVDTDTELLENAPKIVPIEHDQVYRKIEEVIQYGQKPDLAIIATPIPTHHVMVKEAMERGINVICEKNMASTIYQGRQMLQLALDHPELSTGMGFQRRYSYQNWTAKKYLQGPDNQIGKLSFIEWDDAFGGADADRGYSARQTADGGYIMAGYTGSFGAGLYDLYLVKTDGEGTEEWSQAFGGTGRDYGQSVVQTADGGYLAAGYTLSYGAGGDDVWLVRTNADGDLQWDTTYGGSASDVAYAVANTSDGGYVVTGHTLSFGSGVHDVWLIRLASEGPSAVAFPDVASARMALDVRPNPFSQAATIGYAVPGTSKVRLYIHDTSGRLVRTVEEACFEAGSRTVLWDGLSQAGGRVAPGVYFCRLEAGGLQAVVKMVRTE